MGIQSQDLQSLESLGSRVLWDLVCFKKDERDRILSDLSRYGISMKELVVVLRNNFGDWWIRVVVLLRETLNHSRVDCDYSVEILGQGLNWFGQAFGLMIVSSVPDQGDDLLRVGCCVWAHLKDWRHSDRGDLLSFHTIVSGYNLGDWEADNLGRTLSLSQRLALYVLSALFLFLQFSGNMGDWEFLHKNVVASSEFTCVSLVSYGLSREYGRNFDLYTRYMIKQISYSWFWFWFRVVLECLFTYSWYSYRVIRCLLSNRYVPLSFSGSGSMCIWIDGSLVIMWQLQVLSTTKKGIEWLSVLMVIWIGVYYWICKLTSVYRRWMTLEMVTDIGIGLGNRSLNVRRCVQSFLDVDWKDAVTSWSWLVNSRILAVLHIEFILSFRDLIGLILDNEIQSRFWVCIDNLRCESGKLFFHLCFQLLSFIWLKLLAGFCDYKRSLLGSGVSYDILYFSCSHLVCIGICWCNVWSLVFDLTYWSVSLDSLKMSQADIVIRTEESRMAVKNTKLGMVALPKPPVRK